MITLSSKSECCGCEACVQVCPSQCISMVEDHEGFRYPHFDVDKCVGCGVCRAVCPELNRYADQADPFAVYGAKSLSNELRLKSSSGGVFSVLSQAVIRRGGVVFGATFDERWEVHHSMTTNEDELEAMRGSKYLQSRVEGCYTQVYDLLREGRMVLFSGTPCQVGGLMLFLGREYDSLITLSVACHGVASPKVWRQYLEAVSESGTVTKVNFRDKRNGWSDYNIVIESSAGEMCERAVTNKYMSGFVKNLFLRPSCYDCPSKGEYECSDITMADFWGVSKILPKFADDRGVSLLVVRSMRADDLLHELNIELSTVPFEVATAANPSLTHSAKVPTGRARFFEAIDGDMMGRLDELLRVPLHTRIVREIKWGFAKLTKNK